MKVALFILLLATATVLALQKGDRTRLPRGTEGDHEQSGSVLSMLGGVTMGGTWSAKVRSLPSHIDPAELQMQLQRELDHLESLMSNWREDSELSRFNRSASTEWQSVSSELAEVVSIAQEVSQLTDGAFDITVAPLVDGWGFGAREGSEFRVHGSEGQKPKSQIPNLESQNSSLNPEPRTPTTSHQLLRVRLSPPALRKDTPQLRIDLGGIGKGYACDRLALLLDQLGLADYLVTVGGENRAQGIWRIGIETPTPDLRRVIECVDLQDAAISTSGDYRNFRVQATSLNPSATPQPPTPARLPHIIDPRTGRPIRHRLASVSVMCQPAARADALATGLMVLGPDNGHALARRLGISAVFIERGESEFAIRRTTGDYSDP